MVLAVMTRKVLVLAAAALVVAAQTTDAAVINTSVRARAVVHSPPLLKPSERESGKDTKSSEAN